MFVDSALPAPDSFPSLKAVSTSSATLNHVHNPINKCSIHDGKICSHLSYSAPDRFKSKATEAAFCSNGDNVPLGDCMWPLLLLSW